MKITRNAPLQARNTLALPAVCRQLIELENRSDIKKLPIVLEGFSEVFVLGGGCNTVFVDRDYPHTVITHKRTARIEHCIQTKTLTSGETQVIVGAAADWSTLVVWSVNQGLGGIENLASIPGSCGAAPVQNIGAYGVELKDVLDWVEVFDWQLGEFFQLDNAGCRFAYRDSLFKQQPQHPWLITRIALTLRPNAPPRLGYAGIREQLERMGVPPEKARPKHIAQAITAIRAQKLPDPARYPNAGSFFKNPVISKQQLEQLKNRFGDVPHWPLSNKLYKVSAAWLIEQLGLKNWQVGGAEFYPRHALIVVNRGQATGQDVQQLSVAVNDKVCQETGIVLEVEPVLRHASPKG